MDGIVNSMDMNLSKHWEIVTKGKPSVLESTGFNESDRTSQLNNKKQKMYGIAIQRGTQINVNI